MSTPVIAILAGGASRRMGRDKAGLLLNGETLLHRTARIALLAAQSEAQPYGVRVIGRECPALWDLPTVSFQPDARPGLGPVGGLRTALSTAGAVTLIACDMPGLTPDAIVWMLDRSREHGTAAGVAARTPEGVEPLFSSFHSACLPIAEDLIQRGDLSLKSLIRSAGFAIVDVPEEIARLLVNVNTEEDFARFRARASGASA